MKYSLRNFAITFIISLVIFGAIAWGIVGSLKNMSEDILTSNVVNSDGDDDDVHQNNNDLSSDNTQDFKGNSFNFLAVGLDKMPTAGNEEDDLSTMKAIMLVRADKENKKFVFLSLPTDFVINFKGENMTLGELTKRLDINDDEQRKLLLNKITAITGLSVDYYAFIDMATFVETLDNLGGITYNAPQDMEYEDEEQDLKIKFRKNQKLTSGEDILNMLRFVTYNESAETDNAEFDLAKAKNENTRISLHMSFVNALFEKMLTAENLISVPIWVPDLFKATLTNFTLDVVKSNIDLIFSYKDYTTVNLTYSQGYINQPTARYSDSEPNKELIKAAIARISAEIGKPV